METFLKTFLSLFLRLTAIFSTKFAAQLAWRFFCIPRIRKKTLSKNEQALLKQAERIDIDCKNERIAVYQWQNKNFHIEAKTVMLSHGWGGHALNFSYMINRLLEHGYNVLAYDCPAHGNSSGKYTNLLNNAQALLTISKNVAPIHVLIGHSFGSISNAYALDLAKGSEQLKYVRQIVSISGPNKLSDIFSAFTRAMNLPNQILEIFFYKVEALTQRKMQHMSTVNFLQQFSGNILVIHDHGDRVVPFSDARAISSGTGAKLYATTGYGHGRILLNENVANEIIQAIHD